jgi:hypothetical protein
MPQVTDIHSVNSFCTGCYNLLFFCDCVHDICEDGYLNGEDQEENDDENEDEADTMIVVNDPIEDMYEFTTPVADPFGNEIDTWQPSNDAYTPIDDVVMGRPKRQLFPGTPPRQPPLNKPKYDDDIVPDTPDDATGPPPSDPVDSIDPIDIDDPRDNLFPDGKPANKNIYDPSVNSVPVPLYGPLDPFDQPPKLDYKDFISATGTFIWNSHTSPNEKNPNTSAVTSWDFYSNVEDPPVWPKITVLTNGKFDSGGVVDPEFINWFDNEFAPAAIDYMQDTKKNSFWICIDAHPERGPSYEYVSHNDKPGEYKWKDVDGVWWRTKFRPMWPHFFNPYDISDLNEIDRPFSLNEIDIINQLTGQRTYPDGTPRSSGRNPYKPPYIFPDSWTSPWYPTVIKQAIVPPPLDPNKNNPSNNPGIVGTGVLEDVYRGQLFSDNNAGKVIVSGNVHLFNGVASNASKNGNMGDLDTFIHKDGSNAQNRKMYFQCELKSTDSGAYALVEVGFKQNTQISGFKLFGTNVFPRLIVEPVVDLNNAITVRERNAPQPPNTAFTTNLLVFVLEPGDFQYVDTTNPSCIQPYIEVEFGLNHPSFDIDYVRTYRKSTSLFVEYGPDLSIPGTQSLIVPNETVPGSKNQPVFINDTNFNLYPQINNLQYTGTRFGWSTRALAILDYPCNVTINLTGATPNSYGFNFTRPTGFAYALFPIGQRNGISTNATNAIYTSTGTKGIYDYRIFFNYVGGLWVTTN